SLFAHGEPMVWLTGGALAISLAMIVGLLVLVVVQGGSTFWPTELVRIDRIEATPLLGEIASDESYRPEVDAFARLSADALATARASVAAHDGVARRRMLRTGNFE